MKRLLIIFICICGYLTAFGQIGKLSPFVRQALISEKTNQHKAKAKAKYKQETPCITAFVQTTDFSILRQEGCKIYAQWDDICIASIPLNKLNTLANMPQIERIEANESCCVTNDTTAAITRTRDVWSLSTPSSSNTNITGEGVVVGVMDIGFDLTHPTFYGADGQTYRIKQLWDMLDSSEDGEAVTGNNDTIYVGRQYIGTESLLKKQHTVDGLTQTHGTHTAGTAAGSRHDGRYSGMALDADICLVNNKTSDNADLVPNSELYKYTTATDMLGFKYIFDYADKVGKPCVINFSEGTHDDLYQSGIYTKVLNKMLKSGHIICSSAGNEGSADGTYIHKKTGESGKGAFLAKSRSNVAIYVLRSTKPVQIRLSFYRNNTKALDKNYDLTELAQFPDSMMRDSVFIESDTLLVALQTYPSCFDESLYATDLFLYDKNHENCGYSTPTSLTLLGEDNDVEAICSGGYFVSNTLDSSLDDFDNTHSILFPAASENVICVGGTSYVKSWNNIYGNNVGRDFGVDGIVGAYSSIGPALNGLTKPDVVAPGTNIVSALNSFWREENPSQNAENDILHTTFNGRTYPWGIGSGTSMAAPVVTGIVALWLQVCPTLTPDQIKDVIAHTATHYDESLTYPNNYYGWGQIDALAGVEYIEKTYTGILPIENEELIIENANGLYSLDGRKMNETSNLHGIFIEVKNGRTRKVVK